MTQTQERPIAASAGEPTPPAATKQHRFDRRNIRKWRNRCAVVAMVVVAALIGVNLYRSQAVRDAHLNLGELMLTSQPIPVETSLPGLVTSVSVASGQSVVTGQRLGAIEVTTTNSKGHAVLSQRILRAPRSGIVVNDPLTVGSTLQPGIGFVVLYDPADLTLVTNVPLSYLPEVAPGMTANLHADGVSTTVKAVLKRAVPRIGTAQDDVAADHLQLVFTAQNPTQVARLIPGLRFTGSIDTRSGQRGVQPVVYVK